MTEALTETGMNITISTLHVRPRYNPSQEVYVIGLLAGLAGRVPQDMRVTVLVTSENRGLFPLDGFMIRECPCIPSTTRRILWEQRALPRLLTTLDTDVYHGTGNMALLRFRGPQAVTVHLAVDFEVTGGWRHNAAVAWRRWIIGRSVRAAGAVICASRYLSNRLLQIYQLGEVDARKMHVAPMGVDTDLFHPGPAGDGEDAFILQKLGVSSPYVFGYADILGLKNVPRILKSWAALRRDKSSRPVKLVLMGDPAGRTFAGGHLASLGALRDDVQFLGFVTRRELAALYRGARALVFPSLAESFGLCIVEAMACGTPVLTSDVTAMPEVAGGAAVLVDPHDTEQIQDGMDLLVNDEDERGRFIEGGLRRARDFSWATTAEKTLAVYRSLTTG